MPYATGRHFSSPADERAEHPLLALVGAATPSLAPRAVDSGAPPAYTARMRATLRNPDLVADLRQARVARFASRYEWLALRRRRAQIAARHALLD